LLKKAIYPTVEEFRRSYDTKTTTKEINNIIVRKLKEM
jgi:hypothetical protein